MGVRRMGGPRGSYAFLKPAPEGTGGELQFAGRAPVRTVRRAPTNAQSLVRNWRVAKAPGAGQASPRSPVIDQSAVARGVVDAAAVARGFAGRPSRLRNTFGLLRLIQTHGCARLRT